MSKKADFINKIIGKSKNISVFYKDSIINNSGRTSDTKELYTEVIAEWLLQNLAVLDTNNFRKIDREKGYFVKTHNGTTTAANSNRYEERIAMALFRKHTFKSVGAIIDYQTPLKNKLTDVAGKIDLLSCDGKIVRILELKIPDNSDFINNQIVQASKPKKPETMLRCVLESYTYLHTIGNEVRFKGSFKEIPTDADIKASPLVFKDSTQWKQMQDPEYKYLHKLMEKLDIQPFYVTGNCEANFDIISHISK